MINNKIIPGQLNPSQNNLDQKKQQKLQEKIQIYQQKKMNQLIEAAKQSLNNIKNCLKNLNSDNIPKNQTIELIKKNQELQHLVLENINDCKKLIKVYQLLYSQNILARSDKEEQDAVLINLMDSMDRLMLLLSDVSIDSDKLRPAQKKTNHMEGASLFIKFVDFCKNFDNVLNNTIFSGGDLLTSPTNTSTDELNNKNIEKSSSKLGLELSKNYTLEELKQINQQKQIHELIKAVKQSLTDIDNLLNTSDSKNQFKNRTIEFIKKNQDLKWFMIIIDCIQIIKKIQERFNQKLLQKSEQEEQDIFLRNLMEKMDQLNSLLLDRDFCTQQINNYHMYEGEGLLNEFLRFYEKFYIRLHNTVFADSNSLNYDIFANYYKQILSVVNDISTEISSTLVLFKEYDNSSIPDYIKQKKVDDLCQLAQKIEENFFMVAFSVSKQRVHLWSVKFTNQEVKDSLANLAHDFVNFIVFLEDKTIPDVMDFQKINEMNFDQISIIFQLIEQHDFRQLWMKKNVFQDEILQDNEVFIWYPLKRQVETEDIIGILTPYLSNHKNTIENNTVRKR